MMKSDRTKDAETVLVLTEGCVGPLVSGLELVELDGNKKIKKLDLGSRKRRLMVHVW